MSRQAIGYDADGWAYLWLTSETSRPTFENEHPIDADTHNATRMEALRFLAGELAVPHDDREAWKRYRHLGHSGPEALDRVRRLAPLRARFRDAGAVGPGVPHGSFHGNDVQTFADVPGLVIRPFGADDFDLIMQALTDSGIYAATCPGVDCQCSPPEAHAWLQLAARTATGDAYQFCLEFNGRPLQHEIVVRQPQSTTGIFTLTVHHTRERPAWFWREAEQPVYRMLRRHGLRSLESRTRSDRPDWIQSLKDNYGAAEVDRDALTTHLSFPFDMSRFTGWPTRRSVAPGWSIEAARRRVWEATAEDFPAVRAALDGAWADRPDRRALTDRMLEEWWHLDRATLLLGAVDGELRDARLIRPRRPGVSSVSMLLPAGDDAHQDALILGGVRWMAAAGYQTASMFVPADNWASAKAQAVMARAGWTKVADRTQFRSPFTEVSMTIADQLAKAPPP